MSALRYAAVAAVATLVGAAGARTSGVGRAAGPDSVTTHGEWVKYGRGSDSIRAYVAYPERK